MQSQSLERRLIGQWINSLSDFRHDPEWYAERNEKTRDLLSQLKEAAKSGRIPWHRFSYWEKWIKYFLKES